MVMGHSVIKSVDARMISLTVTGVDDMPVWRFYNMHSTGTVRPSRVEMRWENRELVRLAVYGKRIKNDGTVGNGDTSTQFVQEGRVLEQNVRPAWLTSLVRRYAP